MTRGFSLYLDIVRFAAAILVCFSHLAYSRYTNGELQWVRDLNIGSDSVILFFVLSGFVISYTTLSKRRGPQSYAKARLSRLYSVIIPALLVTVILDRMGAVMNPARYDGWWHNGENMPMQLLRGLTFTSQNWFESLRIGTNGPYWSVVYEAWYYAAFGIVLFTRGLRRILLLLLIALVTGPRIILLAPCWWIGVALQRALSKGRFAGWCLALIPWALYIAFLTIDLPQILTAVTYYATGQVIHPNLLLGFSDEFLWNFVIAVLFCFHFLGVHTLAKNGDWISFKAEHIIRWAAGATFSLYLFHYPILTFLYALPFYEPANPMHWVVIFAVTIMACFALAEISERRLSAWRLIFDRIFKALTPRKINPGFQEQAQHQP